jgi:hypothetical protein
MGKAKARVKMGISKNRLSHWPLMEKNRAKTKRAQKVITLAAAKAAKRRGLALTAWSISSLYLVSRLVVWAIQEL